MLKEKPVNVTYQEIATRSGLTVGFIESFASGAVKSPTITRVESLYNTLQEIKAETISNAKQWGDTINVTE